MLFGDQFYRPLLFAVRPSRSTLRAIFAGMPQNRVKL